MEINVRALLNDIKKLAGYSGRGSTSQLAMKSGILPATLYNMEKLGKDFTVTTLVRLVRGTGVPWDRIGTLLERHFKE